MVRLKQGWWLIGLAVALLVVLLSPLASNNPDGLEKVVEDRSRITQIGVDETGDETAKAPLRILTDYLVPGVESEAASTILAGVIGTVLLFFIVVGFSRLLRARKRPNPDIRTPGHE